MKNLTLALALLATLFARVAVAADAPPPARPFLNPLFGDNMVLQRGRPVPFWGWTTPGRTVTVRVGSKTAQTVADGQGQWRARLPALPVGGPYTVTVSGPETQVLRNVLVGDVWVCSGQSNMEFGIGNGVNAAQEIAQANYPQIRLFTVGHDIATTPQPTPTGEWQVCTPKSIATDGTWNGFSAVAYFFGRDLTKTLHVPIGLVHTSWGGTPAQAWTSARALSTMPDFRPAVAQMAAQQAAQPQGTVSYPEQVARWYVKNDPGSAGGTGWADAAYDASSWKTMTLPTAWEQAGVPELSAFDGIVWFRKEFDLPAEAAGKDLTLNLGPIDDADTTWVNGRLVGQTDGFSAVRRYTVPAAALHPGRNVIAVRVLDTSGAGGLDGTPDQMSVAVPGAAPVPLAGPWSYQIGKSLAETTPLPVRVAGNPNAPTVLYNGMIAPLIPYGIKGAIWYQGESNAGQAYQYRTLLPTMIGDWRTRWGEGPFPFLIVQLANYMARKPEPGDDAWAELREAQSRTARTLPNTGIAVTIDIGDAGDIHPKDKQDVGDRLARAALAIAYHQKREYSGPQYAGMKIQGSTARLSFTHLGGGLVARGGKLTGFAVAGPDRHFVWADAAIQGNTIVVSAPQVPHPAAVRYAWASNPDCSLYNAAGLPASPFRTDSWPGITVNAH